PFALRLIPTLLRGNVINVGGLSCSQVRSRRNRNPDPRGGTHGRATSSLAPVRRIRRFRLSCNRRPSPSSSLRLTPEFACELDPGGWRFSARHSACCDISSKSPEAPQN